MKITDVKLSDPVYIPNGLGDDATVDMPAVRALTFLRISTDEGLTGIVPAGGQQAGPNGETLNKVLIEDVLSLMLSARIPSTLKGYGTRCTGVVYGTAEGVRHYQPWAR